MAITTDAIKATSSNSLNTILIGLKNKLIELCEMSDEKRQKIGGAGRSFVLKEKNSRVQTRNIIELINKVYKYKDER